uniref:Dimer_Tnp_hAT domain-containing protein n=1 Tax=Caenorhabditis japonica TaxID=281687 RepID=A0A8R1ENK2_CAEJA
MEAFRMPSQEWLRKRAESDGQKIFEKIAQEITNPIKRNECCLVLDFGKKVYNFLSVFVVFLSRREETINFNVRPFMFMPTFEQKTTERIVEYIVEGGERMGLTREDVLKMSVVGDGAANIRKLGDYFKSYTLCSCHSLQKAAERVLDPLEECLINFSSTEISHLEEVNSLVDECSDLATTLRRNRIHHKLPKLPVAYCQTRWMTFVNCCQDIIDLFPQIEMIDNARVDRLREKIRPKLPQLITAVQILKLFEIPLKIFEKTEMRIHEVGPWLFKLQKTFQDKHEQGKKFHNYTLEVVAKSAKVSIDHYIKKTISPPHLLASILCPGMRNLSWFPPDYKKMALELIERGIQNIDVDEPDLTNNENDDPARELYDEPPPTPTCHLELQDYRTSVFTPLDTSIPPIQFWNKHKNRFPRLSKLAARVYCLVASESICERSFSALNRIFRNDRQCLDPELVEILMVSFLYLNSMK